MIWGLDTTDDLPDGAIPLEAVALTVCLTEDGTKTLAMSCTKGVSTWEAVGMLTAGLDTQRANLQASWEGDDDDA